MANLGAPERNCYPQSARMAGSICKDDGCFATEAAFCFFASRSASEMAAMGTPLPRGTPWSTTAISQRCFASLDECSGYRNGLGTGTGGQPPTKSECIKVAAREAVSEP
jgi:hypothetical protein